MIVLDTTVLVYAVGSDHPLREPCRALIDAAQRGDLVARTSVEVIQEFAHVRARRRDRRDATLLARSYAGLLQPLIVFDERDLHLGMELFEHHQRLGAFDAVLAAAVARRGARCLVSADDAFAEVAGVTVLNPATDLSRILRS